MPLSPAVQFDISLTAGKVTAVYGRGVCTTYISDLCLHMLPAQGLRNGDENRLHWSQSCDRALLTIAD